VPFTSLQKAVVNNMNESLKVRAEEGKGCGVGGTGLISSPDEIE
jgi:hypothetical protein